MISSDWNNYAAVPLHADNSQSNPLSAKGDILCVLYIVTGS